MITHNSHMEYSQLSDKHPVIPILEFPAVRLLIDSVETSIAIVFTEIHVLIHLHLSNHQQPSPNCTCSPTISSLLPHPLPAPLPSHPLNIPSFPSHSLPSTLSLPPPYRLLTPFPTPFRLLSPLPTPYRLLTPIRLILTNIYHVCLLILRFQ